jgi:hypothetical protein
LRRSRLVWLTCGLALECSVALALFFVAHDWRAQRVTRAKFDTIQVGMNLDEVHWVLADGKPPPSWNADASRDGGRRLAPDYHISYRDSGSRPTPEIVIGFDSHSRVADKRFIEPSFAQYLRCLGQEIRRLW